MIQDKLDADTAGYASRVLKDPLAEPSRGGMMRLVGVFEKVLPAISDEYAAKFFTHARDVAALAALEKGAAGATDRLSVQMQLLGGLHVHEDEVVAVPVGEPHAALVDGWGLDFDALGESLVDDIAAQDVLELGAHDRRAIVRLGGRAFGDGPQLAAVEPENHATLEVVRGDHGHQLLHRMTKAKEPGHSS